MDRRTFLKTAAAGSAAVVFSGAAFAADRYFPTQVNQALFEGINRVKDPAIKTGLEKSHAPVLAAPASVKAGEPFNKVTLIGRQHCNLHGLWEGSLDIAVS